MSFSVTDLCMIKNLYLNKSKAILSIKALCHCLISTIFAFLIVHKIAVSENSISELMRHCDDLGW